MWSNSQCSGNLVIFSEEIYNRKLLFCAVKGTWNVEKPQNILIVIAGNEDRHKNNQFNETKGYAKSNRTRYRVNNSNR